MNKPVDVDDELRADLIGLIPHMRAFALFLSRDPTGADDLAQEALTRAWACRSSYTPGTNLKAWVFMILRNQFYSDKRRSWRVLPLDPALAEERLVAVTNPTAALEVDEVRRAMLALPEDQREALILVSVAGVPYHEAALICGCAEGTIKSRVSRARQRLAELLAKGDLPKDRAPASAAMFTILAEARRLQLKAAA